jgi:hypothetical protein
MYSPRSESNLGYTKDDDDYKYGVGDPKEMDKLRDQKQSQKEAEEKTDDLPHLKISIPKPEPEMPPMMPEEEEEEEPMMDDQFNEGQQFGAMTGMPDMGNLSLGAATGTMPAPGGMLATGEPMAHAWSSLMKQEEYNPFDLQRTRSPDFTGQQSRLTLGYPEQPDYDKAIGLTFGAFEPQADPTINLASRNPGRAAPKDAYFKTEDVDELARRIATIDAHEALAHAEDPSLAPLLGLFGNIKENMPDDHPNKKALMAQIMAGIETPGVTMEELTNEVLDPTREPGGLNQSVREHLAQRAAEPGAMFGFGEDTLSPEQLDVANAERNRIAMLQMMGLPSLPQYSSFGKASPIEDAWSTLMKSRLDDMGGSKDQSWKQPQYEIQPGGADISTATSRRSKLHSRFLKPAKKRGLDKSPLAVHRSHLGIETKQPLRLFPRGYDQQMGTMQRRKLMGNVPVMPAGHAMGAESAYNPKSPSMAASAGLPIREPRAPRLKGQALAKSELQLIKSELEEIKKKKNYMQFAQIRRLLRQLKDAAERQERRLKAASQGGHGKNREVGHREGQDSTTRPEGATEDMENDPKNWGAPSTMFAARGSGRVG